MLDQRQLIAALIRLHDVHKGHVAQAAEVNSSNFVNWLKGDNPRMYVAEDAQMRVLQSLGVTYGELTNTRMHHWSVRDNIEDVRQVLITLAKPRLAEAELYAPDAFFSVDPNEAWLLERNYDVVIRLPGDNAPVWILITRPLMGSRPPEITGKLLGITECYRLKPRFWFEGLEAGKASPLRMADFFDPKNEAPLNRLARRMAPSAAAFDREFGTPPPAANEDERTGNSVELVAWNAILKEALSKGMSYEDVMARTRDALGLGKKTRRKK